MLPVEHSLHLLYSPELGPSGRLMLITHDCDIDNPKVEKVELIGALVAQKNPREYSNRKSPRLLDLEFSDGLGHGKWFRLDSSKRYFVTRDSLGDHVTDSDWALSDPDLSTLRQWLVSWYARPAFPDEFNRRMRHSAAGPTGIKGKSLVEFLDEVGRDYTHEILDIFFDLGDELGVELPAEEPYSLRITVVYDETKQDKDALRQVINGIESVAQANFGVGPHATGILLEACVAVSDEDFTLRDLRRQQRWMLDHVSLKKGVEPQDLVN